MRSAAATTTRASVRSRNSTRSGTFGMPTFSSENHSIDGKYQVWLVEKFLPLLRQELEYQRQRTVEDLKSFVGKPPLSDQLPQDDSWKGLKSALAKTDSCISSLPGDYPSKKSSDSQSPRKVGGLRAPRRKDDMSNHTLVDGGGDESSREKEESVGPLKNSRPSLSDHQVDHKISKWCDADEAIGRIPSTSSFLNVYKKHANVVDTSLTRIVHSICFRVVMSLVIVANTVLIGTSTEYNVKYAFEHKKQADQANERLSETIFTAIFTVEIALRIFADRWQFFARARRFWNIFDAVLVVQALVVVVAERTQTNQGLVNMSFARVIRILRFARVLRLVRVIRLFRGFKIMVHCLAYSIFQLMWVFFMLLFVLYFFAVVILQGVSTDVGKMYTDGEVQDYELLKESFGDLPTTIVALFMVITGGKDWAELYTPLAKMSATYGGVLVFYIYFAFFGVLNVVTSVFVDATYNAAQTDPEIFIDQELDRSKMYTQSCVKFFLEADKELSGSLTRNGFLEFLSDAKAAAFFNMLELDQSQAEAIYTLLDPERKDSVDIEDFVEGCSRLRGGARSIDVNMLLYENQEMIGKWTDFMDGLQDRFNAVENKLGIVHSQMEAGAETKTLDKPRRSARSAGEIRQPWSMLNGAVIALEQSQSRHSFKSGSSSLGVWDGNSAITLEQANASQEITTWHIGPESPRSKVNPDALVTL